LLVFVFWRCWCPQTSIFSFPLQAHSVTPSHVLFCFNAEANFIFSNTGTLVYSTSAVALFKVCFQSLGIEAKVCVGIDQGKVWFWHLTGQSLLLQCIGEIQYWTRPSLPRVEQHKFCFSIEQGKRNPCVCMGLDFEVVCRSLALV
jgi:hypothetical protein